MNLTVGTIIGLAIYTAFCLYFGLGKGYDKETVSTSRGYFIGDGTQYLIILMTTLATYFSTWIFLGAPGAFFKNGVGWIASMTWQCPILLMMGIIAPKFWRLGKENGYVTPSDLLEDYYGGTGIRRVVSISQLAFLIPSMVAQISGIGLALSVITGGTISPLVGSIYAIIVVSVYVFFGGFKSQAWVDTAQVFMFMAILWITVILMLCHPNIGGMTGLFAALEKSSENLLHFATDMSVYWNWKIYVSFLIIQCMGAFFAPYVWQRMYAAKDSHTVRKMAGTLAPFYCLVMMIPALLIGLSGKALGIEPENADSILVTVLRDYSPIMAVVCVIGVCAAGMSTISSLVVSATSIFSCDIAKKIDKDISDKKLRNLGRIVVLILMLIALVFTRVSLPGIAELMNMAMAGFALAFWPVIGIFVWKRATRAGVFWSYLIGAVVAFFMYMRGTVIAGFNAGFWSFLITGIIFVAISLCTKPVSEEHRKRFLAPLETTKDK